MWPLTFPTTLIYAPAIHRVTMRVNMSPKSPKSERRKKTRKSPPSLVYVELGTENGGMLKDLSEEGFSLRTMMPVRAGYKTAFSIVLNASMKIEGQGEVLWIEENGRVAGFRFAEIPAEAVPQIQGWLNGTLENLESKPEAKSQEPALKEASSFEKLRQELHGSSVGAEPPPPELVSQALPALEAGSVASVEASLVEPGASVEIDPPPAVADSPPLQELPPELHEPAAAAEVETHEPVTEPLTETASATEKFPGLPDFSSTLEAIEITFDAIPPAPAPMPESFPRKRPWKHLTPLPDAEGESFAAAGLPEISKILIQPPGVEREFAISTSVPTAQDTPAPGQAQPPVKWVESFTLPRAVTLMTLLVLLVAFAVFHRAFGNGLIWLGEALGGGAQSQSGQSVTPNPADDPSSPQVSSVPAISSGSGASSTGSVPGSTSSASQRESTSNPLPAVARSVKPSPNPLAGNGTFSGSSSGPGGPGSPQETGLTEYSKALQLLHGQKGGADTSEAVRLLWDSVGKGNTSAEVTLAELYWHGEGIEHNCDQARNLLTIAAGKGNADAKKQLERFQQEGCQ